MSLDIYLELPEARPVPQEARIFVREGGSTREVTREEWDARFPGTEPVVCLNGEDSSEVFHANVTHNLNNMADAAGLYGSLWYPEENGVEKAGDLIAPLRAGIEVMRADPPRFEALNPKNGWGSYVMFLPWLERLLAACEAHPTAIVRVWR